jgi:restriction system protein
LATRHSLIATDKDIILLTSRGRQFIVDPAGKVAAEIDGLEGTLTVLRLVAEKDPGWRGEFLPGFTEHCHTYTTLRSDSAIKSYLYNRLNSLVERGYVTRRGLTYEITDAGLSYLDTNTTLLPGPAVVAGRRSDIHKLAKELRQEAREQLADYLAHMDPFKFEGLVKVLLEEMGYEDVETTAPTNDKGVDVIAHIELGISSVREVIQVKRHKGSLNRTVLDQLRGSLYRFNAVRGTIISTGKFSRGARDAAFERGAPPITLIDGDKLLDLLMERQIGVTRKSVEYYEFDPTKLAQFELETSINGSV